MNNKQFERLHTKRVFDFGGLVGVERLTLTVVVFCSNSELIVFALFQLGNTKLVHVRPDRVRHWLPFAGLCVHFLDHVTTAHSHDNCVDYTLA